MAIFRQGTNAREYEKITIFDQIISLYLANDARESHSYYGRRIRKPHPSFRMMPVWMTFSDLFKVTIIQPQIIWKWYDIQLYLQWPTNIQSYMIYRTASFSITLNDPTFSFKVTPFFDAEYLRNGTTYRHNFNEILKGSYTRLMQQCHFEWPWVTLQNIHWHKASCSVSATAKVLVVTVTEGQS